MPAHDSENSLHNSLPIWKQILFTLFSIGIIFALLEAVLYLTDVKPDSVSVDPYVGFVPSIPLYVEQRLDDQSLIRVTAENKLRLFNAQSFSAEKSSNTRRIFCLGGSTTYGRPFDDSTSFCGWLREYLHTTQKEIDWQVINAGGISYASYRVAALMEELTAYAPDLFIVYSGHNEFLERRTYAAVLEQPDWIKSLHAGLSQTRTYSSIKHLIASAKQLAKERGSSQHSLKQEVTALLDSSVGLSEYHRDQSLAENIRAHYRYNLQKMIDISRQANAEIMFITPASNLRSSSPFKSEFQTQITAAQQQQVLSLLERAEYFRKDGDLSASIEALQQALAIDDRYAQTLYQLGQALFADGQVEKASELLLAAREEDICPLRILSPMLNDLASIAAKNHTALIDFDAMIKRESVQQYGHAIPGHEFFYDHVHPSIQANNLLAQALFERMKDSGLLDDHAALDADTLFAVQARIESRIDKQMQSRALRNLAKVLSWAGKNEDASRLARMSIELTENADPKDNAESLFILGVDATRRRNWSEAEEYFRASVGLDPGYTKAHNNLGLSLVRLNRIEEAIGHYQQAIRLDPEHASAHYNLANAYARLNKDELAIELYESALRLLPDDLDSRYSLAKVLARTGQDQRAVALYLSVLETSPDDADSHYQIAQVLIRLQQYRPAEKHLSRVLELGRGDADTHIQLAELLERDGRLAEAKRHYELARQSSSADDGVSPIQAQE